jgi:hypothetical protein
MWVIRVIFFAPNLYTYTCIHIYINLIDRFCQGSKVSLELWQLAVRVFSITRRIRFIGDHRRRILEVRVIRDFKIIRVIRDILLGLSS